MFNIEKFNERCEIITKKAIEQMENTLKKYQLEKVDIKKEENSNGSKSN